MPSRDPKNDPSIEKICHETIRSFWSRQFLSSSLYEDLNSFASSPYIPNNPYTVGTHCDPIHGIQKTFPDHRLSVGGVGSRATVADLAQGYAEGSLVLGSRLPVSRRFAGVMPFHRGLLRLALCRGSMRFRGVRPVRVGGGVISILTMFRVH